MGKSADLGGGRNIKLNRTPSCAWAATYPAPEHVPDDITAGALYTLRRGAELIAAGTIRRCPEHDEIPCWTPMRNPCDLMRIGVTLPARDTERDVSF